MILILDDGFFGDAPTLDVSGFTSADWRNDWTETPPTWTAATPADGTWTGVTPADGTWSGVTPADGTWTPATPADTVWS